MKFCRENDIYYNQLLKQSGTSPAVLNFYYDYFQDNVKRPPELREVPEGDSLNYLVDQLNIKDDSVQVDRLLEFTDSNTIEEAIIKLNTKFNDKIIDVTPLNQTAIIHITPKASRFTQNKNQNGISNLSFLQINNGTVSIDPDLYINSLKDSNILLNNPNEVYTGMCKTLSSFVNVNEFIPFKNDKVTAEKLYNPKDKSKVLKLHLNTKPDSYIEISKDSEFGIFKYKTNIKNLNEEELNTLQEQILKALPKGACLYNTDQELPLLKTTCVLVGTKNVNTNIYQIPNTYDTNILPVNDLQKIQNSFENKDTEAINNMHILSILDKLQTNLGIVTNIVSHQDIDDSPELSKIPNVHNAAAFVHKGQIYVNNQLATVDSATHELMHILLGHYKSINSENYYKLIEKASTFPSFQNILQNYSNRAQSDAQEEVFVNEVSKWLTGSLSCIGSFSHEEQYELQYNIYNVLDSIIRGEESVESFEEIQPLDHSLRSLAEMLNKVHLDAGNVLQTSEKHRALANLKESLFMNNELKEIC